MRFFFWFRRTIHLNDVLKRCNHKRRRRNDHRNIMGHAPQKTMLNNGPTQPKRSWGCGPRSTHFSNGPLWLRGGGEMACLDCVHVLPPCVFWLARGHWPSILCLVENEKMIRGQPSMVGRILEGRWICINLSGACHRSIPFISNMPSVVFRMHIRCET